MSDDFDRQRAFGKEGEVAVASVLQRRGWGINPTYEYSGAGDDKAPKLRFQGHALVLPDLDCARDGTRLWVEVKHYTSAAFNRALRCDVHGIARKHYQDYLRVQQQTGTTVWLAVREVSTSTILVARLDALQAHPCLCRGCAERVRRHGAAAWLRTEREYYRACTRDHSNRDLVYFRRADFTPLADARPQGDRMRSLTRGG